jgi:hypothetical protein
MSRESMQRILMTRDDIGSIPGTPAMPISARGGGGAWKSVVLLLLLFGIGIAAGLYVTAGESVPQPAAADTPVDAGDDTAGSPSTGDAAVAVPADGAMGGSAVDPGEGSGNGSAKATVKPPPKKQPPPRKPPKKLPPGAGSAAGSASTVVPPKKCDPFANSKGCQ